MIDPKFRKLSMEMELLLADINPRHSLLSYNIEKTAQSAGLLGKVYDIASSWVKEQLKGKDTGDLIALGLDLVVPTILYIMGHGTFSIIISLAMACGFDFEAAYTAIKDKIKPYIQNLDGKEPNHDSILETITNTLSTAVSGISLSGIGSAAAKIIGLADDSSINDMIIIRNVISSQEAADKVIKNAGLLTLLKGGFLKFFGKILLWTILAVLSAVGLYTGAKAVGLIKGDHTLVDPPSLEEQRKGALHLNPSLSSDITENHENDLNHVWVLDFEPGHMEDQLKEWAMQVYSLTPEACEKSQKFSRVLELFRKRNSKGSGAKSTIVPDNYTSIKEIVDDFAHDVITKMTPATPPAATPVKA